MREQLSMHMRDRPAVSRVEGNYFRVLCDFLQERISSAR